MLFGLATGLHANNFTERELMAQTQLMDVHVTSLISQTDITLSAIGEIFSHQILDEEDGHDLLQRFVTKLDGVRAIIFIGADGALKYDSFSFPVPKVNLSTREYFTGAQNSNGMLIVGSPVVGKSSGIPFIPIAKSVQRDGAFAGVLVAIVTPETMIVSEHYNNCVRCVSLVTDLSGNILSQFPAGMTLDKDLRQKLQVEKRPVSGTELIDAGLLKARIFWRRSDDFSVISIFLEYQGD